MDFVSFAGNDYLGLAADRRLADAAAAAAYRYGISTTSSRWGLGWNDLHQRLEEEMADFLQAEAACLLGAAYFGGLVYYTTIREYLKVAPADPEPVVCCDEYSHSNQFLGMRAAGLRIDAFRHLDEADLASRIAAFPVRATVIATDGVFGISGEVAPAAALQRTAAASGCELFVDDAHGVFVLGDNGRGVAEACGLPAGSVTILGSMSKAMGVNGGFLAGRRDLVELFRRNPAVSGSAVPPSPMAAACLESLRIIRTEPGLRSRMWTHADRMRRCLHANGIGVVGDRTPIVAMIFPGEGDAVRASGHFLSRGLRIPHFRYASEPRHNLLRAAAKASYTEEHLERFEEAVSSIPASGRSAPA